MQNRLSPEQTALQLAEEYSIPVFPCRPDKKPYTLHGFKDASCSIELIVQWWQQWPDALVGVPTGPASKLFVIDVDPKGLEWYRANEAQLACGRIHNTRRGFHLVYRMLSAALGNSAGKIADGVDTRGEGGYIIFWPAHGLDVIGGLEDLTETPSWVIDALIKPSKPNGMNGHALPEGSVRQGEGNRNSTLTALAGSMRRAGFSVPAISDALHKENYQRFDPPLPGAEVNTICGQAEKWEQGVAVTAPATAPRRVALNWEEIEGRDPPKREWVIPHWLPAGHVTLLAGRGGIGKTLLAQHIGTAAALGRDYIEPMDKRRVLMWGGEDDEAEFWRRQIGISAHFNAPLSALVENFFLHSYAGDDITLMAPVYGELKTTLMLAELVQQVGDYRAELVILDNIARLFGGSENDRHAVTTFCALVHGACAPATVLLLGHPAKAEGSEYSGSTAWEGAVRARLYLSDRPPDVEADADDGAQVDDSVRFLSRRKANYSALDIRRFTMAEGGILIPDEAQPVARVGIPSGEFAKDIVRRAITKLAAQNVYGLLSTASPEFLPKLAKQYGLLDRMTPAQFGKVMREMLLAGELTRKEVGKYANRTPKFGLVVP